jgi:hypothetical protein
MGLLADYDLVWHAHDDGWVARAELRDEKAVANLGKLRTYRFAHINIVPWHIDRVHGKVYADVSWTPVRTTHWLDSIDDAKLWVEAIYALEQ